MRLVSLSSIDEKRFKIKVAKAPQVTFNDIPDIMDFCRSKNVKLLIARCLTSEINAVQEMERRGFLLMDTLIYYKRDLIKRQIPEGDNGFFIRAVKKGEEKIIERIASASFKGYSGHYHSDDQLSDALCDAVYQSWAVNSCFSKELADEVLVAELNQSIAGFATMKMKSEKSGEGVLFGVAPEAQGKGVYHSMIVSGMKWCLSQNAEEMAVSTQITNIPVQKVWVRNGFEPVSSCYTFHKWFD